MTMMMKIYNLGIELINLSSLKLNIRRTFRFFRVTWGQRP